MLLRIRCSCLCVWWWDAVLFVDCAVVFSCCDRGLVLWLVLVASLVCSFWCCASLRWVSLLLGGVLVFFFLLVSFLVFFVFSCLYFCCFSPWWRVEALLFIEKKVVIPFLFIEKCIHQLIIYRGIVRDCWIKVG